MFKRKWYLKINELLGENNSVMRRHQQKSDILVKTIMKGGHLQTAVRLIK